MLRSMTNSKKKRKKRTCTACQCSLRPHHGHVTLEFSWWLCWQIISSRINNVTAKRMRRSAFFWLKGICGTTVTVILCSAEYPALTSKWGKVSATKIFKGTWSTDENGMLKWNPLWPGSLCFAKYFSEVGPRTVSWTFLSLAIILSSLSLMMTLRQLQANSIVFLSKALAKRALLQPRVSEVLWTSRIFHTSKQMYVPELTSLKTLVITFVTNLFSNTRHHRRHKTLWEHSSSPSSL